MKKKIINKSIDIANKLLNKDLKNTQQHFAFIFERNKLIAIGQNEKSKTSGFAYKMAKRFSSKKTMTFPYIHAEISSINKLWGKYLITNKNKLVSLRINRFGELRNSKPCVECALILNALNVNFIYFDGEKFIDN